MKISRFLMLLLAMTMIVFTGCDNGGGDDPKDKCKDVTCEEGFACDPGDGLCYDSTTDKCAGVICGDNESCDPDSGLCEEINIGEMDTIVKVRMFSSVSGSQEGILLEKPLEGVVVAIKGLPTSNKHAVILRQADANEYAGIYVNLDGLKAEPGFPTLAIGNLIEIKGKVVEYFDRTELLPQAVSDIVVKTASVTLPAPIDVKSSDFQEKYESMVLNLTNVPFTVTTAIKINYCGGEGDSPCPEGETCQDNGCVCFSEVKILLSVI